MFWKSITRFIEFSESEAKVKKHGAFSNLSSYSFGDRFQKTYENTKPLDVQEDHFRTEAKISIEQGDLSTAYSALISCGKLCCIYEEFDKANNVYKQALDIAKQIGSSELINHAKVAIGIVEGNKMLQDYGLFDANGNCDISLFKNDKL